MAQRKLLVGMACACFALLSFGSTASWPQQAEVAKAKSGAPEESKESKRLHDLFMREISPYEFSISGPKPQKLVMRREPVFRYPNAADWWGEIFVWTDRGRPVVVGSIWGGKRPDATRRIFHEFHSLAAKPLIASGGATGWQPEEEGVTFQLVPDGEEPARDKAGRLTQMGAIASRFSATMMAGDAEVDLLFMPQQIYRYELTGDDSPVVDGALFAYVARSGGSNDPEVLLALEAQPTEHGLRWHYAPFRFTNREAWVKYKGEELWRVQAGVPGIFDGVTTKRYGTFLVKTLTNDDEEK